MGFVSKCRKNITINAWQPQLVATQRGIFSGHLMMLPSTSRSCLCSFSYFSFIISCLFVCEAMWQAEYPSLHHFRLLFRDCGERVRSVFGRHRA